jgi:hypothetical protein
MSKKPKKTAPQPGISFEEAVAAVQGLLDPSATVLHNQRLMDRVGHRRQFDVVIRAKAAGHDVLGVIECKDLRRPGDSPEVNAFADKARNVNANVVLMVSRRGFTKPALELARFHGIGTFSLLKHDHTSEGVTFGVYWYATVLSWNTLQITLHFDGPATVTSFSAEKILIDGKPLLAWLLRRLHTTHDDVLVQGWYRLAIDFNAPTAVTVEGAEVRLVGIHIDAERLCKYRRKRIVWAGKALYDWSEKRLTIPANESLVTQGWRADFSDWDEYEGPLPVQTGGGFIEARFTVATRPDPLPDSELTIEEVASVTFGPTP